MFVFWFTLGALVFGLITLVIGTCALQRKIGRTIDKIGMHDDYRF